MNIAKIIYSNGFVLLIPIFVWNIIFASKLPHAFDIKNFDIDIPRFLLIGENIFRVIIFTLPLLFKIDISTTTGKLGLALYIIGSLIYFVSWLLLIYAPNSLWSISIFGFTAPAYTPIIWLVGIALMADSYNFSIKYIRWHYIIPCIIFIILHVMHSILVYLRTN